MSQLDPAPREAILVVNARSRKGEKQFHEARRLLEAADVRLIEAHAVHEPSDLIPKVRGAVVSGAPMVIVGGGDGSLSSTIDEFVGRDCVFALLPLGTANSFARTLGLPLDLGEAVRSIANGRLITVDLGVVNGDYFVNSAALGISPMIGETVPHNLKRYLGRIGYAIWAARCLLRFKPFRVGIECDGVEASLWASEVRILNGRYHAGVEIVEDEPLDDGEIVIQVVTGTDVRHLVVDWLARFLKLSRKPEVVREFRGGRIRLSTEPTLRISVDGEVLTQTPAEIESARRVVRIAVHWSGDAPENCGAEVSYGLKRSGTM